ncbi:FMN-binding negative transcriptional regulator [Nocardioides panacisoli]|uniref:FMN-binding negative transcriptional regulator n=1 Tax=Nocardioides panacisoli TaxID=627624 RepID=UPI001C62E7FB|nr:FMN-binding negative transcriptional regulator [Nocardioides panacisoli]QYJ05668.1 FMN-binding negative transcriptional regulator [Nocardioides panacisoli]
MEILPWDRATSDREWRAWLATTERFGLLTANNCDPAAAPIVVPTHFTLAGDDIWLHLSRSNPAWPHLEAAAEVRLALTGDHAYVPSYWRAAPDTPVTDGVPTSYYTSVQFVCHPAVVDDPDAKAGILRAQLADLQPEGGHAEVTADGPPHARMLPGIRGLVLTVLRVEAKFKYDDEKPVGHRSRVSERLDERNQRLDRGAARQQRRRRDLLGDWRERPEGTT